MVHSLRHSTPTFALLNDANPTRVQMMRHQHYATTEIYVEEVQKLLDGAEEAVTQILDFYTIVLQRLVSSSIEPYGPHPSDG